MQSNSFPADEGDWLQSFDAFSAVGIVCIALVIICVVRYLLGSVKQEQQRANRRKAALDAFDAKSPLLRVVHKDGSSTPFSASWATTSDAAHARGVQATQHVFGYTEPRPDTFKISYASHSAKTRDSDDYSDYVDSRTDDRNTRCYE